MNRRDLIFRVFVSSTFEDLKAERNALQEEVFPKLREYCQQHGARFQAVDLRWGVSQEAALNQQTMNICNQELHRCQELSPKPNFIVLLGNRYGWRPLPPQVDATEFESLLASLTEDERKKLNTWYRRDDNAVPPEYVLLPRNVEYPDNSTKEEQKTIRKKESDAWRIIEAELLELLVGAVKQAIPPGDPGRRKYFESATHQEIRRGALDAQDAQNHVFCYYRDIAGAPEKESMARFIDKGEPKVRLEKLKTELKNLWPEQERKKHVFEFSADWHSDGPHADLADFCKRVQADLRSVIDEELAVFKTLPELDRERDAHREFAEDRSCHFIGRQDVLRRIRDYVESDDRTPLIIHGKSGSGKTALMAKAWLDSPKDKHTAARFIGATPGSSDLRSLLTDLCRELGVENPPQDMNELIRTFRGCLSGAEQSEPDKKEYAPADVVLFLDALDQLNPTDNAHMLYWIPRELAHGVKVVMSVLETERKKERKGNSDQYDLVKRIWPDSLVELGPLDDAAGADLLDAWLKEAHRDLQPDQRDEVLDKFGRNGRPFFLKLAFEEARRWKSWEGLPGGSTGMPGLQDTIEGILDDLFRRLEQEQHHGKTLVSRALGYIGAGKNGLTEDELLDVLSRDEDVMKDFFRRSPDSPPIDRLPVVVWSRLFSDIQRYMTQRRADGAIIMDFYHRQVGEAVARRYLPDVKRLKAHQHLADYFHDLDYWAESIEEQRARAKRLPPTPRPANIRKVVELPHHRLEAAKLGGNNDPKSPLWDAVADLLTDWQFLEAKAEADPFGKYAAEHEKAAGANKEGEL